MAVICTGTVCIKRAGIDNSVLHRKPVCPVIRTIAQAKVPEDSSVAGSYCIDGGCPLFVRYLRFSRSILELIPKERTKSHRLLERISGASGRRRYDFCRGGVKNSVDKLWWLEQIDIKRLLPELVSIACTVRGQHTII